jgi:signal transduction histidine kinase
MVQHRPDKSAEDSRRVMVTETDSRQNDQPAEALTLEQKFQKAQEQIVVLRLLQNAARAMTSELKVRPLLHQILSSAMQVAGAEAGALLLLEFPKNELVFAVTEGGGGSALEGKSMPLNKGIAGWVAVNREPLIVADVSEDNRHYQKISEEFGYETTSVICVPMLAKGQLIGVLELINYQTGQKFDSDDIDVLSSLAAQSAIAIENARLYESLQEERDRILAVEEEVRKRIASDLHDGPAQLLAALIMGLNLVNDLQMSDPQQAHQELTELRPVAEEALKQVRTLLFDLRPVILETKGLIPAIKAYAQRMQEDTGIEVSTQVRGKVKRLKSNIEVAIFLIIQEAVNNARKHSQASKICIQVDILSDFMRVIISDNGVGFRPEEVMREYDESGSLGLLNMRERAGVINAEFRLLSTLKKGTKVVIELPLAENMPANA